MWRIWSVLVVGLVMWWPAQEAEACSCVPPGPPARGFEQSAAVMAGTVTAVGQRGSMVEAQVEVEEVFKGVEAAPGEQVWVYTATSSAACGINLVNEARYLMYMHRDEHSGELIASLCSRTQLLREGNAEQDEELATLRALREEWVEPVESGDAVGEGEGEERELAEMERKAEEEERLYCPQGHRLRATSMACVTTRGEGGVLPWRSALHCLLWGVPYPAQWECVQRPVLR